MNKFCGRCKTDKPLTMFARRGKGWQSMCKACNVAYQRDRYQNEPKERERCRKRQAIRFAEINELTRGAKDVPCTDCGVKYPFYVMQFDHIRDKLFTIGGSARRFTIDQIREEIKKCEVVCANCHFERTYRRKRAQIESTEAMIPDLGLGFGADELLSVGAEE